LGGIGSGRRFHHKRIEVESCKALAIRDLRDAIRAGPGYCGDLTWWIGKQKTGAISYEIVKADPAGLGVRLIYTLGKGTPEQRDLDYTVPLLPVAKAAGQAWYFQCMASRSGGPTCCRRVGKLYLPPGGQIFACRLCYNLTYRSCNESHKWDGIYKHLAAETGQDPRAIARAFGLLRRYRD